LCPARGFMAQLQVVKEWGGEGGGLGERGDDYRKVARFRQNGTIYTLQRRSHLCIPFLGIAWPQPQFPHSCVCDDLYISRIGPHISCSSIDRSIVGIK
jgi:hypothetical protein